MFAKSISLSLLILTSSALALQPVHTLPTHPTNRNKHSLPQTATYAQQTTRTAPSTPDPTSTPPQLLDTTNNDLFAHAMKDHSYIYARAINSSPEPAFLAKADLVISLPLTIALGGSPTSTTTPAAPDATTSTSTTSDSSGAATGVPTSAAPIPINPGTSGTSSSGIQTSVSTTSTISTNPENKDSPATGVISASAAAPSSPSSRSPSHSTSLLSSPPSPSSPSSSSSGHSSNLIVIIGGTLGCLLLVAVLGAIYFYKRHRNLVKKITHQEEDKSDLQSQSNSSKEELVPSPSLRRNPQEFLEEKSNPDQYAAPDQGQNTRTYRNPQQLQ